MYMKKTVKLYWQPHPESCSMLASWPGIGNVSLIVASYLIQKLGAEEIGEIDSTQFFEPTGVVVKDNIVENPRFPKNKFYYWEDAESKRGLLLFVGESQPSTKGRELVDCVLDVAQKFNVQRLYSCAAAITQIHYSEESSVWGAATSNDLVSELEKHDVELKGELRIAGLNGLVLGMLEERNIEGICLLGEVPSYATQMANPKAAVAVTKTLTEMLAIDVDLMELVELAERAEERMQRAAQQATAEYIDQFTEPIWERGDDEINSEDN